jgi:hypothetical protein
VRGSVISSWFQPGSIVDDLEPGQAFNGILEMSNWTDFSSVPGLLDIDLQYWIPDPYGTITFFTPPQPPLIAARDATYRAISFAHARYGEAVSYQRDIRPLFTEQDVAAMRGADFTIDLADYQQVKYYACRIYHVVKYGIMPCAGKPAWPADWVSTFGLWMDEGTLP